MCVCVCVCVFTAGRLLPSNTGDVIFSVYFFCDDKSFVKSKFEEFSVSLPRFIASNISLRESVVVV